MSVLGEKKARKKVVGNEDFSFLEWSFDYLLMPQSFTDPNQISGQRFWA